MPEHTKKPFHESIVDALYQAPKNQLVCLGNLILKTWIPKNHDQIIEAWKSCTSIESGDYPPGVIESLLKQKQRAAALPPAIGAR